MDAKASAILTSYQDGLVANEDANSDTDSLLDLLDDETDPVLAAYRDQRAQQLARELQQSRLRADDAATVETLTSESQLFDLTVSMDSASLDTPDPTASTTPNTSGKQRQDKYRAVVVHFFHPDFRTCALLDTALAALAARHFNTTKFVRINAVTDAPFLTAKFGLRVLPAVLGFAGGNMVAKFSGLDRFVDPKTAAMLAEQQKQQQDTQGAAPRKNPADSIRALDTQWIEAEFVKAGLLFRNTKAGSGRGGDSDDDEEPNRRSIRSATKSSWTRSVKTNPTDDSDDDDGLDL